MMTAVAELPAEPAEDFKYLDDIAKVMT